MNDIPDWVEFTFVPYGKVIFWGAAGGYSKGDGLRQLSIWTFPDYLYWKNHEGSIQVVRQLEND